MNIVITGSLCSISIIAVLGRVTQGGRVAEAEQQKKTILSRLPFCIVNSIVANLHGPLPTSPGLTGAAQAKYHRRFWAWPCMLSASRKL
jgi:hypothetical protein